MEKMLKVGVMPGRISEYAVEVGVTIEKVLNIAGLDSTGYEIKVDGSVVDKNYQVSENDNLLLLVKLIKGNAPNIIKVGVMPGRIQEVAYEDDSTVGDILSTAGLDSTGYEIKIDGDIEGLDTVVTSSDNLILLVKRIKGN